VDGHSNAEEALGVNCAAFDHTPWKVTFADGESVAAALAGRSREKITQVGGYVPHECLSWPAQQSFGLCSFACSKFRSFPFPSDLAALGVGAFCGSSLEIVNIPDSVREVGNHCFAFCDKLKEVSLGNGLSEIADHVFEGCVSLELVRLPPRVCKVGDYAFSKTRALRSIDLACPQPGAEFGPFVFESSGLVSVKFERHSWVWKIASFLFLSCHRLERVELGPQVAWIDGFAFAYCSALRRIDLSCLVDQAVILFFAFAGSGLVEVDFPPKLGRIALNAFENCESLVSVRLPRELRVLESGVFKGCKSLRRLALGDIQCWETNDFCPLNCIERMELIGADIPSDKAEEIETWLAKGARVVSTKFAGQQLGRFAISSV
jgi:hypothetical protein